MCTLVGPELPLHLGLLFPRTAETIIYLSHSPHSSCNRLSLGWSYSANIYPKNQQQTHRVFPHGFLLEPLFCTALSLWYHASQNSFASVAPNSHIYLLISVGPPYITWTAALCTSVGKLFPGRKWGDHGGYLVSFSSFSHVLLSLT